MTYTMSMAAEYVLYQRRDNSANSRIGGFIYVSDILVGLSPFIGNIPPPLDTLSLSLSYLNCINITELN